jgi:YidC/Oxa1 family membrane protein insertase
MMVLPLVFLTVVARFPTGLIIYWMTTNLWTVGQGLITRRLVPKTPAVAARAPASGPRKSSRTPARAEPEPEPEPTPEPATKPAPAAASAPPRRVRRKKKGGARR